MKIGTTPRNLRSATREHVVEIVDGFNRGTMNEILARHRDDSAEIEFGALRFESVGRCLVFHHAREEFYMLDRTATDTAAHVTLSNGQAQVLNNITLVPSEWALSGLFWFLWMGQMNPVHAWIHSYAPELRW